MKKLTLYQYPKCSSCRSAVKFLEEKGVEYANNNIAEAAPNKTLLRKMLSAQGGQLKKLFNTSGQLYREMNMKEKLPQMSEAEALELLSQHGMLVKRPFLLGENVGLLGFKEETWGEALWK
ncbi:UNVERIFIED_CONTAM: hypothetical protein GTU68_025674 [Idotea baltica]|nr:hypothetical protein [Idotea baltica]